MEPPRRKHKSNDKDINNPSNNDQNNSGGTGLNEDTPGQNNVLGNLMARLTQPQDLSQGQPMEGILHQTLQALLHQAAKNSHGQKKNAGKIRFFWAAKKNWPGNFFLAGQKSSLSLHM